MIFQLLLFPVKTFQLLRGCGEEEVKGKGRGEEREKKCANNFWSVL